MIVLEPETSTRRNLSLSFVPVAELATLTGSMGIAGALCLVVGDVLLTPRVPEPGQDIIDIRGSIGASTLYVSGLLGAVAALLYVFGAGHIYIALHQADPMLALAAYAAFAVMLVSTGIYHAVFVSLNFGARVAGSARSCADVATMALALPEQYTRMVLAGLVIPSALFLQHSLAMRQWPERAFTRGGFSCSIQSSYSESIAQQCCLSAGESALSRRRSSGMSTSWLF